jgi:hypothetical protein
MAYYAETGHFRAPTMFLCVLSGHHGVGAWNEHPPVHHEGWMVSDQETVFCWVPVP